MTWDKGITVNVHGDATAKDWPDEQLKKDYSRFIRNNIMDSQIESSFIKSIPTRYPGGLMFGYVEAAFRQLASLREDEVRQIEASGHKVTRIEVDHHGHETMVVEPSPEPKQEHIWIDCTIDLGEKPMKKTGPHMFDEECHCDSCAGYRAKRDAGMHIELATVKREAELCRERAIDEYQRTNPLKGYGKSAASDPIMPIPCSVVLALCDIGVKGANAHINEQLRADQVVHYNDRERLIEENKRLQRTLDAREGDMRSLTTELRALKKND